MFQTSRNTNPIEGRIKWKWFYSLAEKLVTRATQTHTHTQSEIELQQVLGASQIVAAMNFDSEQRGAHEALM